MEESGVAKPAPQKQLTPLPLAVVFLGALMVFTRSVDVCDQMGECKDYYGWGVAYGVLTFAVALTIQIVILCCSEDSSKCVNPYLALVLWLLAVVGFVTLTFKKPFKDTGDNGYFGCWIVVIASTYFLGQVGGLKSGETSAKGFTWFIVLLVASAIGLASTIDVGDETNFKNERTWALICTSMSLVACLVLLVLTFCCELDICVWRWSSVAFLLWWVGGVAVCTYSKNGPFQSLGNGYVSFWGALVASAALVGQHGITAAGSNVKEFNGNNKTLLIILVASLAVLLEAIRVCRDDANECKGYEAWAVACAALSSVIAAVLFGLHASECMDAENIVFSVLTIFLALLWLVGAWSMTFKRPFKAGGVSTSDETAVTVAPGNGYFGAWVAVVLSWQLCLKTCPWVKDQIKKTAGQSWTWRVLVLSSLVVGAQTSTDCNDDGCKHNVGYAVAVGWVSFVIALVYICMGSFGFHGFFVALFHFVWWWVAAIVLTVGKPYLRAGNAYFGIWLSTIISTVLFFEQLSLYLHPEQKAAEESHEPADPETQP